MRLFLGGLLLWASIGSVWASDNIRALIEQVDYYVNTRQETGNSSAQFEEIIKNNSIKLLVSNARLVEVRIKKEKREKSSFDKIEEILEDSTDDSINLLQRLIDNNLISHGELLKLIEEADNEVILYIIARSLNPTMEFFTPSNQYQFAVITRSVDQALVTVDDRLGIVLISIVQSPMATSRILESVLDVIAKSEQLIGGTSTILSDIIFHPEVTEHILAKAF